jgi:hypothetical protein
MDFGRAVTAGTASLLSNVGAPTMSQRVIDLSGPLENGVAADPPGYEMSIEKIGHKGIIDQWARRYKGLNAATLPNAEAGALEQVRLSRHNGTQVDALRHDGSTMASRKPSAKMTEMAFTRFLSWGARWTSAGLRTHTPPPSLMGKRRRRASSIGLRRSPLSSSTTAPVNGLVCPMALSPIAGWGARRGSVFSRAPRAVKGTDAGSWDVPDKDKAEKTRDDT